MNLSSLPRMCAHTVGNVITGEVKAVPPSAETFLTGGQSTANVLVHRMSGTPSMVRPDRTSFRAFSTQKPGRMHLTVGAARRVCRSREVSPPFGPTPPPPIAVSELRIADETPGSGNLTSSIRDD